MSDANSLAERCTQVAELSVEALDWIGDAENADQVRGREKKIGRAHV